MGEEHLDLLTQFHRDVVLAGLGDVASDLPGAFAFFACDLARVGIRAALGFGWADLADLFQSAIAGCSLAGRPPVRIGVVAAELLEGMTFGADVLVILSVPFEVCPGPRAIVATGFVEDRDMWRDLTINKPTQERPRSLGCICDQAFRVQIELVLHALKHCLC